MGIKKQKQPIKRERKLRRTPNVVSKQLNKEIFSENTLNTISFLKNLKNDWKNKNKNYKNKYKKLKQENIERKRIKEVKESSSFHYLPKRKHGIFD